MSKPLRIGFVGLGKLGTPIAANLLERRNQLIIFNRTVAKTVALEKKGAEVAGNMAALARDSDIVVTMVSDDDALRSVVSGPNGILSGLRPGCVHISMSTILPATAVEMDGLHRAAGSHYLSAPVFGRPEAATARKLNFAVSGEDRIRQENNVVLQDAGATGIWDFGQAVDAANKVKLCGNYLIAAAMAAMGESISLAKQSGLDAGKMWDMFTQTLFATPVYVNYGKIILDEKFEPAAFTVRLGLKDLNLVLEQASHVNLPMPLASLLRRQLQDLVASGKDQLDWSAISMAVQKN